MRVSSRAGTLVVAVAAAMWAVFTGELAVARHMGLQTNAFDLGYLSQALWYDGHGEPFRFTAIQGVSALLEGVDLAAIRHPHWLLAFHVEPALLLLAPLYRLWADPRLLLWLQASAVAAGALPAAWLARRLIGSWWAGLAFAAAYLLAPGLEGAVLSDFHMVAIGAALLMCGLWLYETGRPHWALAALALAALTREDAAAAVGWLGVVLLVRRGERHPAAAQGFPHPGPFPLRRARGLLGLDGGWLALTGAVWAAVSIGLIEPFFSGGASAFGARYSWLAEALRGHDAGAVAGWLAKPDVLAYLGLQALTAGLVGLLAPIELAAALPLLAVNALSAFDWMRSGGGHYSALLAPLLLWAGMHGVRRLTWWRGKPGRAAGLAAVLGSAIAAQVWVGASPLHPGFGWPAADARAASVLRDLQGVPSAASVSATSGLYPHLSARHDAYWFPAIEGASWLALDVAGATHPLSPAAMRDAAIQQLSRPDMDLVSARDGLLILRRRGPPARDGLLADDPAERTLGTVARDHPEVLGSDFLSFATTSGRMRPLGPIRFGDSLELAGYELQRWPEVGLLGSSANLATYWRVTAAIDDDLRFVLATTRTPDGALSGVREDAFAAPLWLPTSRWQPGQLMRLETSLGELRGIQAVGVAVEDRAGRRLPASGQGAVLWDGGAIAEVARV
jgi:uncharacterized membrane protein